MPRRLVTAFVAGGFAAAFALCAMHCLFDAPRPACHVTSSDEQPAPQPRAAEVKAPRVTLTKSAPVRVVTGVAADLIAHHAASYRSFIAHGALRCDRDVGTLRLLIALLRI